MSGTAAVGGVGRLQDGHCWQFGGNESKYQREGSTVTGLLWGGRALAFGWWGLVESM